MPAITKAISIQDRPQVNIGVQVSARYILHPQVNRMLKRWQIQNAVAAAKPQLRQAIEDAVAESYARSGLRIITGKLWREAVKRFEMIVDVRMSEILVEARWGPPTIPYFYRRLFGMPFGRGFDTLRPRGYFIRYDARARRESSRALNDAIGHMAQRVLRKEGRKEMRFARTRVEEHKISRMPTPDQALTSAKRRAARRPTGHRLRRVLRMAGAGEARARQLAGQILAAGVREETLAELLELVAQGRAVRPVGGGVEVLFRQLRRRHA